MFEFVGISRHKGAKVYFCLASVNLSWKPERFAFLKNSKLMIIIIIIIIYYYRQPCIATQPIMFYLCLFFFSFFYSTLVLRNYRTDSHQIFRNCVFWCSLNNPVVLKFFGRHLAEKNAKNSENLVKISRVDSDF